MTRKQIILRRIRRVLYLLFSVVFYVCLFVFIDSDALAGSSFGLSLIFLTLFILSLIKKSKPNFKLQAEIKKSIFDNPLSLDDVKKLYRYKGLDSVDKHILQMFFHKDGTRRFLVYQESNSVRVCFEKLEYFDDDTKYWTFDFAQWEPESYSSGIYADAKLALSDNKTELKDFVEDKTVIEKRQTFEVEIVWQELTIESKLIPFGSYNKFDIQIKNSKISDVVIHNTCWLDLSNSKATLYIKETDASMLDKKFKFAVLHEGKIIGKGLYKNKQY